MKFHEEQLDAILEHLGTINYIAPEDIPNIDLYMDQVLSFFDRELEDTKRYPSDKLLTKTMINNYTKNHLLPPPVKKKYSPEHLLQLIYIYYLKNFLSITDIENLLSPMTSEYFHSEGSLNMSAIYKEIIHLEESRLPEISEDISDTFHECVNTFEDAPEDKKEYLQLFSFMCCLGFDIYIKKHIMEGIIDSFGDSLRKDNSNNAKNVKKTKERS